MLIHSELPNISILQCILTSEDILQVATVTKKNRVDIGTGKWLFHMKQRLQNAKASSFTPRTFVITCPEST